MAGRLGSTMREIADIEEFQQVLNDAKASSRPVVVQVSAPWCAPCRGITPLVQSLSEKLSSTTFLKVNVDEVDDFMEEYSVVSLPTFLLYSKDGSQAPTVTGTKWETIEAAIYGVSGGASTASGASTATKPAAPTAAPTSASTKQSTPNGAASASPAATNADKRFTLRLMSNYEALKAAKSEALAAGRAVVIQCSAEWCRPCQFITPKMQELSAETPGIAFFKVDVDEVEDIMDDYKIVSLPTFLMWNADGTKAAAVAGSAWPKIKGAILAVNPSPQVAPGDGGAGAGVGAGAGAGATSRSLKRPRDEDSAAQPAGASKQARPTSLKLTAADIAARVAALAVPAEAASVVAAFDEALPTLSAEEARALYSYKVPMLSTDGGCSVGSGLAPEPFSLAQPLGVDINAPNVAELPQTKRLQRLKAIVTALASYLKAEWGGVYRAVPYPEGGHALMKEAYVGEPSRAYFPLTEEFAKGSNNSTVGLTNSAIIIPDTQHITGDVAYYVCSSKVRSEVCAPISRGGQVIGIIDVEAWDANHFSDLDIGVILMVCAKLGERNLFV